MRTIAIAVVTGVCAFLCGRATLASVTENTNPELSLQANADEPAALIQRADVLLSAAAQQGTVPAEFADIARRSISQDPINPRAIRILALSDTRRSLQSAVAMFEFANRLSRRDVETQLALIELYVQKEDVPAVLGRYDVTLRTQPSLGSTLFPRLASASLTPELYPELVRIFASEPPWLTGFVDWGLGSTAPSEELARVFSAIPTVAPSISQAQRAGLVNRLVGMGQVDAALREYRRWSGDVTNVTLRNVEFKWAPKYPPFDWEASASPGIAVDFAADQGGGMRYVAEAGSGGVIVSQLLNLAPGAYELSVRTAMERIDSQSGQYWTIECVGGTGEGALGLTIRPAGKVQNGVGNFIIPAGCSSQWLRMRLQAAHGEDPQSGFVYAVQISKTAPAARS